MVVTMIVFGMLVFMGAVLIWAARQASRLGRARQDELDNQSYSEQDSNEYKRGQW